MSDQIVDQRERNGPGADLADFLTDGSTGNVKLKLEPLVPPSAGGVSI